MGENFTATYPDGPEFEEGDPVNVTRGPFAGESGVVFGYDDQHEAYLVDFGGDCRAPFEASSLELDTDVLPDLLDLPDEIEYLDRVIPHRGPWIGQAGWVVGEDDRASLVYGRRMVIVRMENEDLITIASESLLRSPYQDEEDLDNVQQG